MQRQYWEFYWPLVLTGLAMLLASQFQNGALARYPDAARELAIFAFASSTFGLFNSALIFVPQMSNILARSRRAQEVCLRFTIAVCLILSLPVVLLAFSPQGRGVVGGIFAIQGDRLDAVILYVRYLLPLILVNGLRHYYTGMLVQAKRTGVVTALNVICLATVVGILVLGFQRGWRAVAVVPLSLFVSAVLHLALSYASKVRLYHLAPKEIRGDLTYREVLAFFWPVGVTSVMFALSRPILYSFVNRVPHSEPTIAALRVAFVFAMMFHNPVNQFRHLFVTFGSEDLYGVRRFMVRVTGCVTAVMLVVAFTPISTLFFDNLLGVKGEVLGMARQVLIALCLVPAVITTRNYFHGLSMIQRRTSSMGVGGILRTLTVYMISWGLFAAGRLNHVTAAIALILGFVAETVGVVFWRPCVASTSKRS